MRLPVAIQRSQSPRRRPRTRNGWTARSMTTRTRTGAAPRRRARRCPSGPPRVQTRAPRETLTQPEPLPSLPYPRMRLEPAVQTPRLSSRKPKPIALRSKPSTRLPRSHRPVWVPFARPTRRRCLLPSLLTTRSKLRPWRTPSARTGRSCRAPATPASSRRRSASRSQRSSRRTRRMRTSTRRSKRTTATTLRTSPTAAWARRTTSSTGR
mmetsp:Transcript_51431/g.155801  ORF Transcript_51431/g.155801 Transcript_51431/m.155801 type:complete len:210 (+) Transcript_51431:976-1605(+)